LDTFNSVPAAPNSAVTRPSELSNSSEDKRDKDTDLPKGIRASQGTGMLMMSRILSQLLKAGYK
jgi:hypothetical protein